MTPWPYPRWIAHRGAGKLAPENTLAAFRLGASHGYRAFECDVKLSTDGVPYLMHDDTLERTTSSHGDAGACSWHTLSRLDAGSWHSRAYAGEPPPTLDAVARYCIANQFQLNIEIKPIPGAEEHTGRVVAQEAARLWAGQAVPPLLTSFRPDALAAAMLAVPALPRGLLIDTLWEDWMGVAQQLQCAAVVGNFRLFDAVLVQQIKSMSMRVMAYTVNEPADAERLRALGLDGLITDAVDRFPPT